MTLVEKIKDLCRVKQTNFAQLEKALGFAGGSLRKWDEASPSGERLAKVADYFHVTTDYLLGREEHRVILSRPYGYDRLPEADKRLVDDLVERLLRKGN